MSNLIRIEKDGSLTLSGKTLPGQITGMTINGKMIIDKAQAEGSSGKKKFFSGFDDSGISIKLILLENSDGGRDRYNNLTIINSAFKKIENESPVIYAVQGEFLKAFNIRHVLFADLSADESNDDDSISVSLNFEEHDPLVSLVQDQQKNTEDETVIPEEEEQIPEGVSEYEYYKFKQVWQHA